MNLGEDWNWPNSLEEIGRWMTQGKLGNGEIWEIGQWINPRRIEVGRKLDNTWT
jgi:hypothetical protein